MYCFRGKWNRIGMYVNESPDIPSILSGKIIAGLEDENFKKIFRAVNGFKKKFQKYLDASTILVKKF